MWARFGHGHLSTTATTSISQPVLLQVISPTAHIPVREFQSVHSAYQLIKALTRPAANTSQLIRVQQAVHKNILSGPLHAHKGDVVLGRCLILYSWRAAQETICGALGLSGPQRVSSQEGGH